MRAAHVAGTHRTYAAKTLLYAGVLGVAGSVIGVYAAAGLLSVLDVSEAPSVGRSRVARVRRRRDPAHGARAPQTLPPVDAGVGDPRRRARGRDVLRAVGAARPTRSRSGSGDRRHPAPDGRVHVRALAVGDAVPTRHGHARGERGGVRRGGDGAVGRRPRHERLRYRRADRAPAHLPAHPERRSGRLRGEPRVRARHRPTHLDVPQRPVRAVSGGRPSRNSNSTSNSCRRSRRRTSPRW